MKTSDQKQTALSTTTHRSPYQNIVEQWKDYLSRKGLISSKQRILIMQALSQQTVIEDMEEFWLQLRHSHKISWATFYSFIRLSVQEKWLLKEGHNNSDVRYVLAIGNGEDSHD